jgi:hypothetical protein
LGFGAWNLGGSSLGSFEIERLVLEGVEIRWRQGRNKVVGLVGFGT